MGETHRDDDAILNERQAEFLEGLRLKANAMRERGESQIASAGRTLREWTAHHVNVRELPADPMGILRISIGGGPDTPIELNYCTFRGDVAKCAALLRAALAALEQEAAAGQSA